MRAGRTRSARPKGKIGGSQALPLPLRGQGRALSLTLRLRLVLRCVRALFGRFRRAAARDLASHPWCFRAALRPSAPIPERRARQPQPMNREARVLRYKEKRKNRKFDKTIRCACYAAHLLARLSDARSRALGWLAVMHRARRMPRLGRASRAALPSAARCRATRATCRRGRTGRRGRAAAAAACRPTTGWMTSRHCSRRRALGARRRSRRRCSRRSRGCVPRGTYDRARCYAARFDLRPVSCLDLQLPARKRSRATYSCALRSVVQHPLTGRERAAVTGHRALSAAAAPQPRFQAALQRSEVRIQKLGAQRTALPGAFVSLPRAAVPMAACAVSNMSANGLNVEIKVRRSCAPAPRAAAG